jgi:hypothetical protein
MNHHTKGNTMNNTKRIALMFAAYAVTTAAAFAGPRPPALTDSLLDAIRHVESGGDDAAVGDGGRAIGPYQIHRAYWVDACAADPSLQSGTYADCFDPVYSRRVVVAYLSRYGRGCTAAQLARIHNGGPRGHRKSATVEYAEKVLDAMK